MRTTRTTSANFSNSSAAIFPARIFYRSLLIAAAATVLALFAARALPAQDQNPNYDPNYGQQNSSQADPPSRVSRVSVMQGNVSLQPANANDFSAAELNYPLTTGDRLYTDANARAELEAGQLSVRLGAQTDLTVTTMTDELAQFGLAQGSVHLRPYALDPNTTTEIDTPNASITVLQPGDFRIDVSPQDGATTVTVLSGQAQVNADGVQEVLSAGRSLRISGGNPSQAQYVGRMRPDALDQFSGQRDAMYQQQMAAQSQYVNPGHDWLRGPGAVWRLGHEWRWHWRRWAGVVSAQCGGGLGTVSRGALGLYFAVGMDVGRGRAVGICAVPLRTVDSRG